MSNLVLCCVFLLNCLMVFSRGVDNLKELARKKRSDIDLQTCIDNFNVHKDKIIRTQDSQNMGAKYLSEIDLGSREECLRLCCETDKCDVFVYEEKNSGSCYLFHCGPPEDFKCKFTHHFNYSSAILAVSRHTPDLENQIKLTKHEQDLSKLRKPGKIEIPPLVKVSISTPSTTTIAEGAKEIVPPQIINQKSKNLDEDHNDSQRRCSPFQFECRSTRDCIAIYNACDGIPQCADGSDEAPELECPPTDPVMMLTTSQTVQNVGVPPITQKTQRTNQMQQVAHYQNNESQQQKVQVRPQVNPQEVMYQPQIITSEHNMPNPHIPSRSEQPQDFLSPLNDPRNVNSKMHYNPKQTQQYISQNQQWMPQQMSGQFVPYDQPIVDPKLANPIQQVNGGSIFNHKETGLQVQDAINGRILDTADGPRYNKFRGAMQYLHRTALLDPDYGKGGISEPLEQRHYEKQGLRQQYIPPENEYRPKNYYENENYRESAVQENWPAAENNYNNVPAYHQEIIQDNNINQKVPSNVYYPPATGQEPIKNLAVNPKHVQDQMAHDLKHSKDNMEHGNAAPETKIKIEKHPSHLHEQYPDVVSYKIADLDLKDGIATIPRGAVLSLTLGLIVTCLMAILIGCRLKVVRRRMRKGGKSYAHDADYLVNGMYL